MRFLCLLTLALAAGAAPAQRKTAPKQKAPAAKPQAETPTRWPVQTLRVEGNRNFTERQVLAVAGLEIGQTAGKEEFEAARDRLVASGAFESVGYRFAPAPDGKGFAASFQVVEVAPAWPVRFEGFAAPAAELAAFLQSRDPLFGPKVPGTKPFLDRYAQALTEKTGEKVAARVTATGPDQFEIVLKPDRPVPVVAQVTFEGNKVVPSTVLTERISGVAFGYPYTEERFRQLLDTSVRPVYDARGRIRVAFPKIEAEPSKEVKGLNVKVTIDEGESYSLGDVKIAGGDAGLLKVANILTGDIANFDEVNAGVDRVKKALARRGYLRAEVRAERSIQEKAKAVDVLLRVTPGPRFTMGRLTIEGLDIIGEPAVRRFWGLKPGAPFDAEYPEQFLARVREEQMFDNLGRTTSSVKIDEQAQTADVTLRFAGGAPPKKEKR